MAVLKRTTTTPDAFSLQPLGRNALLDKIYIGFVKATDDKQRMGRLRVWIPEIGGDPASPDSWITVNYASPFAGATNMFNNTNGNQYQDSQRSYGFWMVPPDLENEVLCCFINGDPGRGIWFACLYQQFMNHMVPGLPGNNSSESIPVGEYNKLQTNINTTNPPRPIYAPLADQLATQGLDNDPIRGVSSSGSRRDDPINSVYGMLTPGGSQIVFDDNPGNRFIRLRTQAGAQILVNDSTGAIYMNSRDGNNWVEMAASGEIDVYAASDISIRSQGSLNLRADLDVNIEAGRSIFMKARNDPGTPLGTYGGGLIKMSAATDIHQYAGNNFYQTSVNDFNRTAGGSILDTAIQNGNYKAGGSIYMQSDGGNADIKAKGEIHATATNVHLNSVVAGDAKAATSAQVPLDLQQKDNQVLSDANFQFFMRNTILYRLPHHEPYDYHAGSVPGTNGHVEPTDPVTDPNLQLIRSGEVVSNQTTPNDIIGSPRRGMPPGKYTGQGYDENGNPVYKYEGGSADLVPAGSMQVSDSGVEFIKRYEGLKKQVYLDVAGLKTVGYGHLLTREELAGNYVLIAGRRVQLDRALTDSEVDTLLRQDIEPKAQTVRKSIKVKITQSQFDMLTSLCFNIGSDAFAKSSLVRYINDGDFERAPAGFMMWTKARVDGVLQDVQGLINRRRAEVVNFRSSTPTNV